MPAGKSASSAAPLELVVVAVAVLGPGPRGVAAVTVGGGGGAAAALVTVVEDGTHPLRGYTSSTRYRFTMPCLDTCKDLRFAVAAVPVDARFKIYPPAQMAAKTAA